MEPPGVIILGSIILTLIFGAAFWNPVTLVITAICLIVSLVACIPRKPIRKVCMNCGRFVMLHPDNITCNRCGGTVYH